MLFTGRSREFPFVEVQGPTLELALETFLFLFFLGLNAPEQVLDPRQQFAWIKGFCHVVICAAFQANDPVDRIVLAGHQDNADIREGAEFPGQRQAIFTGQVYVDQADVDIVVADAIDDAFRIFAGRDGVTLFLEMRGELATGDGLIFDDEQIVEVLAHRYCWFFPKTFCPESGIIYESVN